MLDYVADNKKNIRSTFKLMGIDDVSWIFSTYIFTQIYSLTCATITILVVGFTDNFIICWQFYYMLLFFWLASIFMYGTFSIFIQKREKAKKVSQIGGFVMAFLTIVASFLPQKQWLYILYAIPNAPLAAFVKTYSDKHPYDSNPAIIGITCSALFWVLLFIYLDHQFALHGVEKDLLWCCKKSNRLKDTSIIHTNKNSTKINTLEQNQIDEENKELRNSNFYGNTVQEIKNLTKKFGSFKAVDSVNIEFKEGMISCILGHNGAGKSTLINAICGIVSPTSGSIYLRNENVRKNSKALEGKIGYCPTYDFIWDNFFVDKYQNFIADLKLIKNKSKEVKYWLEFFDLTNHSHKKIKKLSGGQRKKVNIAAACMGSPDIIFLDEPSSGVDPKARRDLWDAIRKLKAANCAIILTTHHLEEAEELANDVIILAKGMKKEQGSVDHIKKIYGDGYEIILENISEKEKKFICEKLETNWPNVKINKNIFSKKETLLQTVPYDSINEIYNILRIFENNEIPFNIKANTLEDAYIKMESLAHPDHEKFRDYMLNECYDMFKTLHQGKICGKIAGIFLRRFYIHFSSFFDILLTIFISILPAIQAIGPTYAIREYFELQSPHIINLPYVTSGIFWYVNILSGAALFGLPITEERHSKMRQFLKMAGIDSTTYYIGTFIYDWINCAFSIILNAIQLGIFGLTNNDNQVKGWVFNVKSDHLHYFILENLLISQCLPVQSYLVQWILRVNKTYALKIMPPILLLYNFGIIIIPSLVLKERSYININCSFAILFPIGIHVWSSIVKFINGINNPSNEENHMFTDLDNYVLIYGQVLAHFILLMIINITIDKYSYRTDIDSSFNKFANKRHTFIYNQKSIKEEERRAFNENESKNDHIVCQNIAKVFKGKKGKSDFYALKNSSFTLRQNEVLGIQGPNGAGKSTTFNILCAYLRRNSGDIKLKGCQNFDKIREFFKETGACFQDDILWNEISVEGHLKIFSLLKNVPKSTYIYYLKVLDLYNFRHTLASDLSSGMKRKLCIILSMFSNPNYKYMDEPSTGVDPVTRNDQRKLIKTQQDANKGSTIYTTHAMQEAEQLCDRIGILVNGGYSCILNINELKRSTNGFNLKVNFNKENFDAESFESALLNNIDDLRIERTLIEEKQLRLKILNIKNLSDLFKEMTQKIKENVINEFWCSEMSLNDIFQDIARYQEGFELDIK